MAKRLELYCPVSPRQKAFKAGDGIAENTFLLQATIMEATKAKSPRPLFLCFIDVKKAFDSVSHQSMLIACRKAGIPEPFINYLDCLYERGVTQLQANGRLSQPIRCRQGVKQGDPLSPTLFNFIIDWCLNVADPAIGFSWAKGFLSYLAFADDLVLLAQTLMSGHKFCAAIALRGGALPCAERLARGRESRRKTCEQCPNKIEYLHHILQVCPRTHGPRVRRHDNLVKKLEKDGWRVLVEPRIPTADSFVKPDLVFWNTEKAVVLDAAVCGDEPDSGRKSYYAKIKKYSDDHPKVGPWVKALTNFEPTFSALVINWRGCVDSRMEVDLRSMGLRKSDIQLLSVSTVEWGTIAHRLFMCCTSRGRCRGRRTQTHQAVAQTLPSSYCTWKPASKLLTCGLPWPPLYPLLWNPPTTPLYPKN